MAPDLDVVIRSSSDPLLFLEYHRHFTHSLAFVPFGALLCAVVMHRFVRNQLQFRQTYLFALIAFATHGLLDACTTYGTMLLWPFSDARIAWNNVSVVDPLFTLPLIALIVLALKRRRPVFSYWAVLWTTFYLLLGVVQHERALDAVADLAESRGHTPTRIEAMPAFASLFLWRGIYEYEGKYYVDAIHMGRREIVYEGGSAEIVGPGAPPPGLVPGTQQALDLERFERLAAGYTAIDRSRPNLVMDMRYGILPNDADGIWGITLDAAHPERHVEFTTRGDFEPGRGRALLGMIFGVK